MITPLLLALAVGATPPHQDEIVIIDDRPSMVIAVRSVAGGGDVGKIRREIRRAAASVCYRAYRELGYLETVACVKGAVADGDAQLVRALAHKPTGTSVAATIAVTAPSN